MISLQFFLYYTLEGKIGVWHCWTTSEEVSFTAITDTEYPVESVFYMLGQIILDFMSYYENDAEMYLNAEEDTNLKYEKLEEFLSLWQNPGDGDKIYKITTDLDEVKEIMKKNIEDLIERGKSLEDLMKKSKDLNTMSLTIYKKLKAKNDKCWSLT